MVGPKKEDFWPRMNKLKEEKEISSMNDGLPKIAIIVFSKSIFRCQKLRYVFHPHLSVSI